MSLSKSVSLHAQTPVPCDACENDVPGEYYCTECKQTLCLQCEKFHSKFTKGHEVVLRSQVGDVDTTTLSCVDHNDKATIHCKECSVPVCIKCVTGKHQGHKMIDLVEIFEKKKKLLQNHIDEIDDFLPQLERRRETIESEKTKYETQVLQIMNDMDAGNQSLHKELDRIHEENLQKLNSIRQSHLLIFDGCTTQIKHNKELCEKRKSEHQEAIGKNRFPTVINFVPRKDPLPEIGRKPVLPVPPLFVPENVKKIEEALVKLHLSYPPLEAHLLKQISPTIISTFTSPLKGNPSISITKDGDVWLGGFDSRELVMVDIKGQILRKRNTQNRPRAFAVMDCGDVIVSPHHDDSSSVSRLLDDGREQYVFNASPSWSYGVSVTADQQILICTVDGRLVRASSDGTNIKQLFNEGSPVYAVEYVDGNIYISDTKKSAILIVNKKGKVLSKITHTTEGKKLNTPLCMRMDKWCNILCADKDNDCIYIVDQKQHMKELVGRSDGIQKPRQLAVDSDNNLWITQIDCTVHVVKYLA